MGRDDIDDGIEALLRERLRAADASIQPPPGLWARIADSSPAPGMGAGGVARFWRRSPVMVVAVAAAVAVVALGVWWLVRAPGAEPAQPTGPGPGVRVKVYNAEKPCRDQRTLECALRLAKDPRKEYSAPDNSAGRVWHGTELTARCVDRNGGLIRDEAGVSSTRWYRVSTAEGLEGWLPGVRTRNVREVPDCPRR